MLTPEQFSITDYLSKTYSCSCGKEHSVPIQQILIEDDAILQVPKLIYELGYKKPFFIYDSTTFSIAGLKIEDLMTSSNLSFGKYIIPCAEPTPDEAALGELLIHLDQSCDLIVAVGTGTINDLCRFLSYKLQLPYMIIATAPSMDGFASNVAPLIVNHMKTTYEAQIPLAILGDTTILKDAPMKMIAAGIGDILGKYTCLCDWKIAHIINDEYHCDAIVTMVNQSLQTVVDNIDVAKSRNPSGVKSIMEALVLSGIAMSYAGNSRPASGSEHHLSHYWEMMFLFDGKQPILHGTKVGIGTIAVLKAYELLMARNINFEKARNHATSYSKEHWNTSIESAYKEAATAVIALENEIGKNNPANVLPRLNRLEESWSSLKQIVADLPSSDSIRHILLSLDAPASPMSVGIDKTTFMNSFLYAKDLRNRFGLLQILSDLGLTEEISEEVWDYFQK
ncbi:MAG: sn-glycerol-1-phosphate dehydrogenase [Mobilitalea sp.]